MYSDQQLADYLGSVSQGLKLNVVKLTQRTEYHYSILIDEAHSPLNCVTNDCLDDHKFQLAFMIASSELTLEQRRGQQQQHVH